MQVLSDNITTVSYINKQGGTRVPGLMRIAEKILQWAETNHLSLSSIHIKEELNTLARCPKQGDSVSDRMVLELDSV